MDDFLARLGIAAPVLQAGMGGGLSGHALAAAVSDAGGLGTIGMLDAPRLRGELALARSLTGRPVAVNLLLPFARAEHWRVADEADAVITFWGAPRRRTATTWIHQCGSVQEACAAHAAGADAVIAQGAEAGGHVRGTVPALELLERIRRALPGVPVLLAGGVAQPGDVRTALEAGAAAVVAGTRFLLTPESAAHPGYKRRLVDADETVLTELFGLGWPAPHRVVPNAATRRWQPEGGRIPLAVRAAHHAGRPLAARMPMALADRLTARSPAALALFGPGAPLAGSDAARLDTAPLYAGETVRRIGDVRPAATLVRELAG